ncbi:MAG: DUF1415 domain-containing protein [Pseudomonadota bacterium]|nr:DUF1415 domain-containing protein [Pseudomonadota bacterium]
MSLPTPDDQTVIADTRRWLERAVIGLNLCPFAKAAYVKQRVHIAVSSATTPEMLLEDLARELEDLRDADPTERETTLLVHPQVLADFLDYNDFLDTADAALEALELDGEIQVASFHPQYQFAGTEPDDAENNSNRSPWPTLHLLREDSIEQAVDSYPDVDHIPERNITALRTLGNVGWRKLWED